MANHNRRSFLKTLTATAAALGGGVGAVHLPARATDTPADETPATPVPLVHATDLFHPHNDPDDHLDLACVCALAHAGWADLKAVVIDYPPRDGGPDPMAVGQMNAVTGLAACAVTGAPPGTDATATAEDAAQRVSVPAAQELPQFC